MAITTRAPLTDPIAEFLPGFPVCGGELPPAAGLPKLGAVSGTAAPNSPPGPTSGETAIGSSTGTLAGPDASNGPRVSAGQYPPSVTDRKIPRQVLEEWS